MISLILETEEEKRLFPALLDTCLLLAVQSQEAAHGQLVLEGGVVLERLQLQLLQLLRVEAELVVPELGAGVDEGGAQRFWNH